MPEPTADEAKATSTKNSFSYQVRYGGDTLVPVYFAEVVLQPR
jgi:hypothetical protein